MFTVSKSGFNSLSSEGRLKSSHAPVPANTVIKHFKRFEFLSNCNDHLFLFFGFISHKGNLFPNYDSLWLFFFLFCERTLLLNLAMNQLGLVKWPWGNNSFFILFYLPAYKLFLYNSTTWFIKIFLIYPCWCNFA